MRKSHLLKSFVFSIFSLIPVFSFTQVKLLIDSLILQERTAEKAIIVENKIGERTEYLFDALNSLTCINRSYISNSLQSESSERLRYYSDSHFYINDSIHSKFSTYILTQSEERGEYMKTLEKQDSLTYAISDYPIQNYNDSIIWYTEKKNKHILTRTNRQFTKYHYQLIDGSRDLGETWMVKYNKQNVFLIDTTHSARWIDYDIVILKYSRLGLPEKIYTYDWLVVPYNQPDVMGYIMSKRQTRKPLRVFEVKYCLNEDCLERASMKSKTINAYLKFTKKYPDYHQCF